MVPSSFGCGSAVLAAMATLAPSRAARSAMARPIPRLAPVMNRVLFARLMAVLLWPDRDAAARRNRAESPPWYQSTRQSRRAPAGSLPSFRNQGQVHISVAYIAFGDRNWVAY